MRLRKLVAALSLLLSTVANAQGQTKTLAERLGYPADSKLLIVHADDLAVAHSVDTASFEALDKNAVTSASVMVPCSWLIEVASYAKDHPDTDLGLHLTLTSEWKVYRWGPVESKDKVGSLLDSAEYLWPETGTAAQNIKPEEAEREIRAQIQRAIAAGIYINAVKNLKPGLTEIIVHLGHDDVELQAVTLDHPDYGSAWRQRDYDFVTSTDFKKVLKESHVILVKWNDLKKLLK